MAKLLDCDFLIYLSIVYTQQSSIFYKDFFWNIIQSNRLFLRIIYYQTVQHWNEKENLIDISIVLILGLLLRGRRANSLKALNLVSMEDVVKLSSRMRQLSPLSWHLHVVEHCLTEEGHYGLARFRAFKLSSLRPHERRLKRKSLCQWRRSENFCDEMAQRTVNRILCWGVGKWSAKYQLHFDVWYMFRYKRKKHYILNHQRIYIYKMLFNRVNP